MIFLSTSQGKTDISATTLSDNIELTFHRSNLFGSGGHWAPLQYDIDQGVCY